MSNGHVEAGLVSEDICSGLDEVLASDNETTRRVIEKYNSQHAGEQAPIAVEELSAVACGNFEGLSVERVIFLKEHLPKLARFVEENVRFDAASMAEIGALSRVIGEGVRSCVARCQQFLRDAGSDADFSAEAVSEVDFDGVVELFDNIKDAHEAQKFVVFVCNAAIARGNFRAARALIGKLESKCADFRSGGDVCADLLITLAEKTGNTDFYTDAFRNNRELLLYVFLKDGKPAEALMLVMAQTGEERGRCLWALIFAMKRSGAGMEILSAVDSMVENCGLTDEVKYHCYIDLMIFSRDKRYFPKIMSLARGLVGALVDKYYLKCFESALEEDLGWFEEALEFSRARGDLMGCPDGAVDKFVRLIKGDEVPLDVMKKIGCKCDIAAAVELAESGDVSAAMAKLRDALRDAKSLHVNVQNLYDVLNKIGLCVLRESFGNGGGRMREFMELLYSIEGFDSIIPDNLVVEAIREGDFAVARSLVELIGLGAKSPWIKARVLLRLGAAERNADCFERAVVLLQGVDRSDDTGGYSKFLLHAVIGMSNYGDASMAAEAVKFAREIPDNDCRVRAMAALGVLMGGELKQVDVAGGGVDGAELGQGSRLLRSAYGFAVMRYAYFDDDYRYADVDGAQAAVGMMNSVLVRLPRDSEASSNLRHYIDSLHRVVVGKQAAVDGSVNGAYCVKRAAYLLGKDHPLDWDDAYGRSFS